MRVRPATPADVPALIALEKHTPNAAHWTAEDYDKLFSTAGPRRVTLLLEDELEVKGFLVSRAVEAEWEIENVAIAAAAQRHGLGTRLVREFLEHVRSQSGKAVFLEVRESNHAARALYEKSGFTESRRRKAYYRELQEDAVVYRLAVT